MPHTRWNTEALWQQLEPLLPGLSIEVVARIDSTNTQLLERARQQAPRGPGGDSTFGRRAGDTQPCLLVAEHQTSGRGRLGRQWKSAADASLTFSLALMLDRGDWSGLSLAIGVALAEALDPGGTRVRLKWPNDLLLADADGGTRKIGGILVESIAVGSRRMAVVGVGINVSPQDLGELPGGYACVRELQPETTPPQVLAQVAPSLVQALLDFNRRGFAPFVPRWTPRDALLGRQVEVLPGGPTGEVEGVADDGALRLCDALGNTHRVSSGEVSVRLSGA